MNGEVEGEREREREGERERGSERERESEREKLKSSREKIEREKESVDYVRDGQGEMYREREPALERRAESYGRSLSFVPSFCAPRECTLTYV